MDQKDKKTDGLLSAHHEESDAKHALDSHVAKDMSYRDVAPELLDSSDYAQGRPVNQYSGGGTDNTTEPAPRPHGSQDWQQGITAANDSSKEAPATTADDPDNDLRSRSADPGQSSYGGFRNEGPSEQASHRKIQAGEGSPTPQEGE